MKRPIYLDYAATTPVAPEAIAALASCLSLEGTFGNPHSTTHDYGFQAASLIEKARTVFAGLIHAYPTEMIYTSGATEANNLAIQGLARAYQNQGNHIISVATEHKAVLDVLKFLATQGFEITYLPVNAQGMIDLEDLKKAIRKETIFASIMMINNETGALHPIKEIANILHQHKVLLHVDAAQAFGKVPVNVKELEVDLMSFSAHKFYGPKGIGALYIRNQATVKLQPIMYGGGQEQNLRPGTLPTPLILAMNAAAQFAQHDLLNEIKRIFHLKKMLWDGIKDLKNVSLNSDFSTCVPHICNLTFKAIDPETFLLNLENDLAIAQGSACTSAHMEPSHVLRAMGLNKQEADSSFRFSFGHYTTKADIERSIKTLRALLA